MNIYIKYLCLTLFFSVWSNASLSQGSAGESALIESRRIVDMPTAGLLSKEQYSIVCYAYNSGGLAAELSLSPLRNFSLGMSYGVTGLIGNREIVFQNLPGFQVHWRLSDESLELPAFLLGFDSQGIDGYYPDKKRFRSLSPGLFLSASKNFKWFAGSIALHCGINYSFEAPPKDRIPNIYTGLEQSIGSIAAFYIEYNATLNDADKEFMKRRGLLNMALKASISRGITIQIQLRDLLKNQNGNDAIPRYLGLEFVRGY